MLAPKQTSHCIEISCGTKKIIFLFMSTQLKKSALLPLSNIKKLPKAFLPTFYTKVVELAKGTNEQMLSDTIAVFADKVAEFNHIVEAPRSNYGKVVKDALVDVQRFWSSTRYLLKGYSNSKNPQEATLARKALDLFQRIPNKVLRTNAAECLNALVDAFDAAWKPADLTGTFLENWRTQLTNVANDYLSIYQGRVDNGAKHMCFTEMKDDVFEAFDFFYMNLHVCVGITGDLSLMELQSKINELIMIYSTIEKSRATRIANQNHADESNNSDDSTNDDSTNEPMESNTTSESDDEAPETTTNEVA